MKQNTLVSFLKNFVIPVAIGLAVAKALTMWVASAAVVVSGSMEPTLPYPTYLLIDRAAIEFEQPYRGEVIMFHHPPHSTKDDPLLKRIIGLPGDTVVIKDSKVYINNKPLSEPYLKVKTLGNFGPYHVPKNSYFVMGDNRNNSFDSRYWQDHYVPRANIIGRVDAVLWPVWDWRIVH